MDLLSSEFWEDNLDKCYEELMKDDNWSKVPLINSSCSQALREGCLVRFRGMVQDMYNPVYYLAKYEVHNTLTNEKTVRSAKYKDSIVCGDHERVLYDSEATVNKERRPVYCISVPAVNEWAQIKKVEVKSGEHSGSDSAQQSNTGTKRSVEDEGSSNPTSNATNTDQSKRIRVAGEAMESESTGTTYNLNLPIPNSQAQACLINFYDIEDGSLKINDVIEVAGFLSYDLASVEEQLPPPSLVPRLHAVALRPVRSDATYVTPQVTVDDVLQNAARLRDELKLILTQLLLGDALAADYLICHLISRIYLRQDITVLGKLSLNLLNIPSSVPEYPEHLYRFLQRLLTKSHYLPMTIETMNTTTMIPKKNYETNILESGMLQLSDKTHLVLDETKLQPGQLNDKGVRNCRALSSVIVNQRLEYDFQFYPVEFNTDIPVLVLSEGKSMLPSDCHLALEPDPMCVASILEAFTAAKHYLKEPLLSQLRAYISLVSTAGYDLSSEVQQVVQEDFVQMRQGNPKTTAQDLHSLLVLAKLLSLSEGSQCLTKECWERARQMEQQRKQRLENSVRR